MAFGLGYLGGAPGADIHPPTPTRVAILVCRFSLSPAMAAGRRTSSILAKHAELSQDSAA
jgi:hypothetical protein